jgi:hypothetical protein
MIVPSLLRLRAAQARPTSPTPLDLERAKLHRLMSDLSKSLREALQDTVEAVCELCGTECAGITLVERLPGGAESLRWITAAGPLRTVVGEAMALDRNLKSILSQQKPRLVIRPHRLFPQIAEAWTITEALLVPWASERNSGILWVLPRSRSKQLNEEDVRMLLNLAAFASFAIAKDQAESSRLDEQRLAAAAKVAHELAHAVNNPLQALTNALYLMDGAPKQHLEDARVQLQRINSLVRVILDSNAAPFKH